jgi:NADH-quinone oxidoreductase subunit C
MAEETPQKPPAPAGAPAAAAARTLDEILADPRVSTAAATVRDAIVAAREFAGEITLTVRRERIVDVCKAFKADSYTYLVDLAGVDYSTFPGYSGERFGVSYHLYSFDKNYRLRLKTTAPEGTSIPSVTSVWKTANWHEREAFDMYGIDFEGHPLLERILMWDGFNGHPLRKDFPVRGIDTGARIYPEVFPEGSGPMEGSTGKDVKDVNIYKGPWTLFGRSPAAQLPDSAGSKQVASAPQLPAGKEKE